MALVTQLTALLEQASTRLEEANAQIEALRAEVAALKAKAGKDSTNSSVPPSKDSIGAKAKRKAVASQRVRSKDRKRGGQPGHEGAGLVPTADPTGTEQVATRWRQVTSLLRTSLGRSHGNWTSTTPKSTRGV